ncbi:hypothetical protein ACH5RR_008704 [Cinchona calisaya]|uniref:Uncharacterized protein n=1 Tax=Cinchona calisaya TaxID=153742 RepID=A0ABD3AFX8_9GENT
MSLNTSWIAVDQQNNDLRGYKLVEITEQYDNHNEAGSSEGNSSSEEEELHEATSPRAEQESREPLEQFSSDKDDFQYFKGSHCLKLRPRHYSIKKQELASKNPLPLPFKSDSKEAYGFSGMIRISSYNDDSIEAVKDVLNNFSLRSSLNVSAQKSHIFFSANTPEERKYQISELLSIPRTNDLGKYVGFLT